MGRFDRYMLQQMLMLFGFFSLVLALIFWVNRAVSLLDWLMGDGQTGGVFLQLTLLSLPSILLNLLPIAAFAATVYATNRLSSESELVVVQAAGYSPYRLARPVLTFGLIVAGMMVVLAHVLVPLSNRELKTRQSEIAQDVTSRLLTESTFVHPNKDVTFYVKEITRNGELRDVFLSNRQDSNTRQSFSAQRALLVQDEDGPKLLMFDGISQLFEIDSDRLSVTRFEAFSYGLDGLLPASGSPEISLRSATTADLIWGSVETLSQIGKTRAERIAEIHKRMNKSFQGVAICLIGFGALLLGGFSRFGLWRQITLAIVLLVVVKTLDNNVDSEISKNPSLWPLWYVPTCLAVIMGFLMLWKSAHPRLKPRHKMGPPQSPSTGPDTMGGAT